MQTRTNLRQAIPVILILTLLLSVSITGIPKPAPANPILPWGILIHVKPAGVPMDIQTCQDIVQYADYTGAVEFELYFHAMVPEDRPTMCNLQNTVTWPEHWTFLDFQVNGGVGSISVDGNGASMDIDWDCALEMTTEVVLLASVTLDVQGYGRFGNTEALDCTAELLYPPDNHIETVLMQGAGEAGVECAYCFFYCSLDLPCRPEIEPTVLNLEVIQGQTQQRQIHVYLNGGDIMHQCSVNVESTEEWLEVVDLNWLDFYEFWAIIQVDTADLPLGFYEGWISMESACIGCTKVNLYVVSTPTGVPYETEIQDSGRPDSCFDMGHTQDALSIRRDG